MREIKFRAWIKDYALMADVNFLNIDYKEIVVMIDENDYEFNCGEYELMQYTGLKDENGREIYEGDIVRHASDEGIYKVTFEDGGFYVKSLIEYDFQTINEYPLEVIGNVWENPELLEVKS